MTKRIIGRYKIPKKEELISNLEKDAQFIGMTPNEYLDFLIKGIQGDIVVSTEVIEQERQKIEKAKKSIEVVLSVMNMDASDQAAKITTKYYHDLLQSKLSEVT